MDRLALLGPPRRPRLGPFDAQQDHFWASQQEGVAWGSKTKQTGGDVVPPATGRPPHQQLRLFRWGPLTVWPPPCTRCHFRGTARPTGNRELGTRPRAQKMGRSLTKRHLPVFFLGPVSVAFNGSVGCTTVRWNRRATCLQRLLVRTSTRHPQWLRCRVHLFSGDEHILPSDRTQPFGPWEIFMECPDRCGPLPSGSLHRHPRDLRVHGVHGRAAGGHV